MLNSAEENPALSRLSPRQRPTRTWHQIGSRNTLDMRLRSVETGKPAKYHQIVTDVTHQYRKLMNHNMVEGL